MWVWSKLSGAQWMDAWEERFHGNPNAVISRLKTQKTLRVEVYTETEEEAESIKKQFGGRVRKLVQKNWAAVTEPERPPLKIRDQIVITGARDPKVRDDLQNAYPNRHIIQIPADMAFGTGDHETTSTCLRYLVDVANERAQCGNSSEWAALDLGTGSGILCIAARMLGAQNCLGIDFDPQAVKVARRNVRNHHIGKVTITEADVLDWQPPQTYQLVAANLFSTILQQAFPVIIRSMAPGADLIVSGILHDQWEETQAIGTHAGLQFSHIKRKGKWVTARARAK